MKAKTQFTALIMLLTMLMIAGLSLSIMMGVMMGVEERWDMEKVGWLLLGLAITVFSVLKIVRLNRIEVQRRVDRVVVDKHDFIAKWEVQSGQWAEFLGRRFRLEKADANTHGLIIGILLGIVAVLMAYRQMSVTNTTILVLSVGLAGFLMGKFATVWKAGRGLKKGQLFDQGEVFFADELVILNGGLIQLKDFGVRLLAVSLEDKMNMSVLRFYVQTGFGNKKSRREHWVPVPPKEVERARALCQYYEQNLL